MFDKFGHFSNNPTESLLSRPSPQHHHEETFSPDTSYTSIGHGFGSTRLPTESSSGASFSMTGVNADPPFISCVNQPVQFFVESLMSTALTNHQPDACTLIQPNELFLHEQQYPTINSRLDFSSEELTRVMSDQEASPGGARNKPVESHTGQQVVRMPGRRDGKRRPPTTDRRGGKRRSRTAHGRAVEMENNRKAAQRYRKKKKAIIEDLQSRATQEEEKWKALNSEVEHLQKIVLFLKERLVNHMMHCNTAAMPLQSTDPTPNQWEVHNMYIAAIPPR